MTTRNLEAGNNPVVIDVRVKDHDATRKLDQVGKKTNSLRSPFLGGALLGGFFGSALLGIALNSGFAAQATDQLASSVGTLLNSLAQAVIPALVPVLNAFQGLETWQQRVILGVIALIAFRGAILGFGKLLLGISLAFRGIVVAVTGVIGTFRAFLSEIRPALKVIANNLPTMEKFRYILFRLYEYFPRLTLAIVAILDPIFKFFRTIRREFRWLRFMVINFGIWRSILWLLGQTIGKLVANPLVLLIAILIVLGVLILDQVFGWGLLDKVLGKVGLSTQKINMWIDEQIKSLLENNKAIASAIKIGIAFALMFVWVKDKIIDLWDFMALWTQWLDDGLVKTFYGVINTIIRLINSAITKVNELIIKASQVSFTTPWGTKVHLLNPNEVFQIPTLSELQVPDKFQYYQPHRALGPPEQPVQISIYGNVYGVDDIGQLLEEAISNNPNFRFRAEGNP